MTRLAGKVALVTGGAGGIGQAIGARFVQEGARVVLGDLNIGGHADRAGIRMMTLDVTQEESWEAALADIAAREQRLDIVVNNAGIVLPPPEGLEDMAIADWKRVMGVNLDGTFLGVRAGIRAMKAGGGTIVNIGSVAAYIGTPGGAAYGASKGGVRALTKQAAVNCAKRGLNIRINAIHPSYVWTPLVEARATSLFGEAEGKQRIRDMHPFRCLAEPIDIANVALFLASDEARLVNGADIIVDGALLAQ